MAKKKSAKSKQAGSSKPKVSAVIACDAIQQDVASGKTSLLGVFDRLLIRKPEQRFRQIAVYTKLVGGKGKHRVGSAIKLPGTKLEFFKDTPVDLEESGYIQGTLIIGSLNVEKEGVCKIYATLDGKTIGNPCSISIVHLSETE